MYQILHFGKMIISRTFKRNCRLTDQFKYRWGDLSVLGCVLNLFESNTERLNNIKYKHVSHKAIIKNKFYLNFLEFVHYKRLFNKFPKVFKVYLFLKTSLKKLIR